MTASDSSRATAVEQGVVIERVFDAPRELVWRAWTEPEHFARWWGPQGFTSPGCQIDLRVGGRYLWGMRSPDGQVMWTTGAYQEIVPLERFVATQSPADEHGNVAPDAMGPGMPLETTIAVTLEDAGAGKTRLTFRHLGWPDANMAAGASAGWNQSFDKLAATLVAV